MSEAKREFMDVNFVGKARPEVLSGAKVYATLDRLANSRRDLLMKDKRALNEKELSYDRQNAFAVQYNEDQIAGLIRYNSCLLYTSPSPRDKRQSRMPSSA